MRIRANQMGTSNEPKRAVYAALISPAGLGAILDDVVVFDCRFSLADAEEGRRLYDASHIPGAVYAHLDEDLSGFVVAGQTGRHPLPDADAFASFLARSGVSRDTQVVCYDDRGGAIAARLWWMMKWIGHDAAAVLDGGWPAWEGAGYPTTPLASLKAQGNIVASAIPGLVVDSSEMADIVQRNDHVIIDARAHERYAGTVEPIDPVAGHIPGARSLPFADNLEQQTFLRPDALAKRFRAVVGNAESSETIVYCGSGVTAAHNALAMVIAGLGMPRLYAGSWSEWITDPARGVALDDA